MPRAPSVLARVLTLAGVLAGGPAAAETRLHVGKAQLRSLERELRALGFDCPRVGSVYFVGEKDDRNHMRVVCSGLAAPDLSQIRIVATGSGRYDARPWDGEDGEPRREASQLPFRTSLQ